MHKEEIEKYDELHSKLLSLKTDFQILSGKKPNDNVNEFKLSIINKVLNSINELIGEYKPDSDFDAFNIDSLPSNSDVLMMMNLYLSAMHRFREANSIETPDTDCGFPSSKKEWKTDDD